jgi:hypothetical protein
MMVNAEPVHWYNGTWWTAVTGAGQVIATIVAAWAALEARRSAGAAHDAVQVAHDSVQATERSARYRDRAYLAAQDGIGPKIVDAETPIRMKFVFKNVGPTPAYDVEFGTNVVMDVSPHSEQQVDRAITEWHQLGTAPPSIEVTAIYDADQKNPMVLGEEAYEQLMRGELVLAIYSKLKYKDIFGDDHKTLSAYEFHTDDRRFYQAMHFNTMT